MKKYHVECLTPTKLKTALCDSLACYSVPLAGRFVLSPSFALCWQEFYEFCPREPFLKTPQGVETTFLYISIFPATPLPDFDFLKRCVQRRAQEKDHGRFGRGGLLHLRVVLPGRHERVQEELRGACERRRSRIGCPIHIIGISVCACFCGQQSSSLQANTAPPLLISPGTYGGGLLQCYAPAAGVAAITALLAIDRVTFPFPAWKSMVGSSRGAASLFCFSSFAAK